MQKDDMTYDRAAIDALCNVGEHNSLSVEEIRKLLPAELEQKNVDELTADSMSRLYSNGFFDGYKQARKDMSQTSESAQWVQPEQQNARIFQGIVVEYPSISTYPEYEGKPYFSIKYTEDGQDFIGYGTYKPEVLSEYLKKYFMPSAQLRKEGG